MVGDNDSRPDGCDRVEIACKIHWQPHATRRCWVARQVPRVDRDAGPGEPLHVRHLRTFIRKLVVSFYCQSICKSAVTGEAISTYWRFLKIASGFHVP